MGYFWVGLEQRLSKCVPGCCVKEERRRGWKDKGGQLGIGCKGTKM